MNLQKLAILLRQSRLAQFWQDFRAKALLLVILTELEIFWQDFRAKALLLVIPAELEIFWQDFRAKVLLLVIPTKLEIYWQDLYSHKSPALGYSYSSRKFLTRFVQKSPSFGTYHTKAVLKPNWPHFTVVEIHSGYLYYIDGYKK